MKKLFTLSVFLFIPLIAMLFVQCTEQFVDPNDQETVLSLNKVVKRNQLQETIFPSRHFLLMAIRLNDIGAAAFATDDKALLTEYAGL